ncbi:MAG: hypothetical protein ABI460_13535 [Caldimonas sp.]
MGLLQIFLIVISLLVVSLTTGAGCRWWYGKKLVAAAQRLHKCDQGRLFSQQQTLQAKKQIETLKIEVAEQRKALQETDAGRERTRELEHALLVAERAVEVASEMRPPAPTHGFADTQVLPT